MRKIAHPESVEGGSCHNGRAILFISALLIFFLFISSTLTAAEIKWSWSNDIGAELFRYQINGTDEDKWTVVDGDTLSCIVTVSDTEPTDFYLEASKDGKKWTKAVIGYWPPKYAAEKRSEEEKEGEPIDWGMRTIISPWTICFYDFFNGHDIPDAYYLTNTKYGGTLETEFWLKPYSWLSLHLNAAWTGALKNRTVVPNDSFIQYVRLSGGIDFLIENEKRESAGIGIYSGAAFGFNANYWSANSLLGVRCFIDVPLAENLTLTMMTRASGSYLPSEEPLLKSMTWVFDPLAFAFNWEF